MQGTGKTVAMLQAIDFLIQHGHKAAYILLNEGDSTYKIESNGFIIEYIKIEEFLLNLI